MKTQPKQIDPLDDLRRLAREELPMLKPVPADASLNSLRLWLAACQHRAPRPSLRHPRLAVFASRHAGAGQERLDGLVETYQTPGHAAAQLAAAANADLKVYALDLDRPTGDPETGPAMSPADAGHAAAYGMMAVQPGIELIAIVLPNPAAARAADEIQKMLKTAPAQDPLDILCAGGGLDLAAALGAALAARLAGAAVLTEGPGAAVIAPLLSALHAQAADHIRRAEDILPHEKLSLPEGGRAALLLPLLKSLCAIDSV